MNKQAVISLLFDKDGAKVYQVEALHVTTTGNKNKYTKEELLRGARSLSFRPLNINHNWSRALPFPQNGTLAMEFDSTKNAVVGKIKISDPVINEMIATGKIKSLSVDEASVYGEECSETACVQKGVNFYGLALLEDYIGVKPGDKEAEIIKAEQLQAVLLSEMLASCSCPAADSSLEKPASKEERMSDQTNAKQEEKPAVKQESIQNAGLNAEQIKALVSGIVAPFVASVNDGFKNTAQLQIEKLSEQLGVIKAEMIKAATPKPSSTVDDTPVVQKESVSNAWNWMTKAIKEEAEGEIPASYAWRLNREAFINKLPRARSRTMLIGGSMKQEAITYSGGDIPEVFDKELFVLPGGRMAVNIRQYLKVKQIPQGADTYNFYQIGGFDVDDTTAEGTEPTNVSQTVTKKQTVPTLYREVQTIKYGDIENAQFDLVEAVNEAALLGSLNVENNLVLNTTADAATPGEWINGKTGGAGLSDDDDSTITTMSKKGILAGLEYLETEGYDTSPGNVVLFAHPKAVRELIEESDTAYFAGSEAQPFTMRQLGILESRFGITIVPSNKVAAKTQTTTHTYRNIMAIKNHTLALAVTANLQVEAQRRPDLGAIKIGMRHRIGSVVFDPETLVRISSEQ